MKFATEMRIHNGYLYFSSELVIYRQKLSEDQLDTLQANRKYWSVITIPCRAINAKSLALIRKEDVRHVQCAD